MRDILLGAALCIQGFALIVFRARVAAFGVRQCRDAWQMEFEPGAPKGRVVVLLGGLSLLAGVLQLWSALGRG